MTRRIIAQHLPPEDGREPRRNRQSEEEKQPAVRSEAQGEPCADLTREHTEGQPVRREDRRGKKSELPDRDGQEQRERCQRGSLPQQRPEPEPRSR